MSTTKRQGRKKVDIKRLGHYCIVLNSLLGKGSYAEVFDGFKHSDKMPVAIKVISRDKLNDKLLHSLDQEIAIMKKIHHENVIRLFDVHRSKRHIYLVMEKCTGGDLAKYMNNGHRPLSEAVARQLLCDLAFGLKVLHDMNLVHRDLKPANLMLSVPCTDTHISTLKIADFGFAREIRPQDMAETLCGSPLYMAPEILGGKKYDSRADLWSVGTIMYEMLFGRAPYTALNMQDLERTIQKTTLKYPEGVVSVLAINLMKGLLQPDPEKRMTFQEFFNHPYLNLKTTPHYAQRIVTTLASSPSSPTQSSGDDYFRDTRAKRSILSDSAIAVDTDTLSSQSSNASTTKSDISTIPSRPVVSTPKTDNSLGLGSNTSEQTDVGVAASFTQVPNDNFETPKTLDGLVTMTSSKHIIFPEVMFDFSKLESCNQQFVSLIEQKVARAWVIAETSFVNEKLGRYFLSVALYGRVLDYLFKILNEIDQYCSQQKHCERLRGIIHWIHSQFDDFLERADRLKHRVISQLSKSEIPTHVCVEDVLYKYGVQLVKEAVYLEYLSKKPDSSSSVKMYKRSCLIFEYLLYDCEHLTDEEDQNLLRGYISEFRGRIDVLVSKQQH